MEVEIGKVKHYYNHLNVAVLNLTDSVKLGDEIHVLGHTTDFTQRVFSMQVDHHDVLWVRPGEDVALGVVEPVREHDVVYRVIEGIFEPHLG
jgi:putative protease